MSTPTIASEIQRITNAVSAAWTAVGNKGGTVPQDTHVQNLATAIGTIQTGISPTGTIQITQNGSQISISQYAYADVAVPPPAGYANVANVTAIPSTVLATSIFVTANGTQTAVTMPDNGSISQAINPMDGNDTTTYMVPEGYHDGTGAVYISGALLTALEAI